jgi:hypothetical protein
MPITVTVRDEPGSGRVAGTLTLDGIDERVTLRDLVRARVRAEVARCNAELGTSGGGTFSGLVMPDGAVPAAQGFRMPAPRPVDWERQADQAVEAFGRNGFFVLVGDRQVTDLDKVLDLSPGTDIRIIRLVQLVGG